MYTPLNAEWRPFNITDRHFEVIDLHWRILSRGLLSLHAFQLRNWTAEFWTSMRVLCLSSAKLLRHILSVCLFAYLSVCLSPPLSHSFALGRDCLVPGSEAMRETWLSALIISLLVQTIQIEVVSLMPSPHLQSRHSFCLLPGVQFLFFYSAIYHRCECAPNRYSSR